MSIKQLKAALDGLSIDYTGCTEKQELVTKLEAEQGSSSSSASAVASPNDDVDMETSLAKLNNLLDTLPAALELLNKKWSEARQEKTRSQLASIKQLLDQTAARGANDTNWQAKLAEYNGFAREFKRLRDMPRNMNG